jgi:hypothetical protein
MHEWHRRGRDRPDAWARYGTDHCLHDKKFPYGHFLEGDFATNYHTFDQNQTQVKIRNLVL